MSVTRGEVHQLLHTLSYGDAISGEALALQRCLREQGYSSEIFAINVHPRYKGLAHDYRDFVAERFSGEMILHYSLGSPLNALFSAAQQATRTLIYHNLTPPKWFQTVNPRITEDIEQGMRELPALCRLSDRVIADSAFNAGELRAIGIEAQVLDLPIDPTRWEEPANPGILAMLRSQPGIHVLHVGRLAPNKCIEDIIKAFYFLHYHVERNSTLWLVGTDIDTELYSFSLKRLARELEVDSAVRFLGSMADSEVRAFYEGASAYVCMSEHEGFCLPLIEAMHFGLPVIAFESSAVPDTLGAGGILVREKRHAELGELIAEVCRNASLRNGLVEAGKAQVRQFSYRRFSSRVRDLLGERTPADQGARSGGAPKDTPDATIRGGREGSASELGSRNLIPPQEMP
jgi:glycosyltransferase involved in cell wall biosynthesis